MKLRELRALLNELDKHPRVTSVTAGGVTVTCRATDETGALVELPPEQTDPNAPLEIPPNVYDPRAAIAKVYAKHGRKPEAS